MNVTVARPGSGISNLQHIFMLMYMWRGIRKNTAMMILYAGFNTTSYLNIESIQVAILPPGVPHVISALL